jgi:hypothetical protein
MSAQITGLERAFSFEDQSLRNYMTAEGVRPGHLAAHHEAMADSEHPIVLLGAGWAAMELATFRDTPRRQPIPLDRRLEAMEQARETWRNIDFEPFIDAQPTEAKQLDAQSLKMRMKHALGSMSAVEVSAHWLADSPLDTPALQHKMRESQLDMAETARVVKSLPTATDLERRQRAGLVANMTYDMTVNNDQLHRYVSLPASVRLNHHPNPLRQADAITISADTPHRKTIVDIKPDDRPRLFRPNIFQVIADDHLAIVPRQRAHTSLEALIKQGEGTLDEYSQLMLSVMTERLIRRLDGFQSTFTRHNGN